MKNLLSILTLCLVLFASQTVSAQKKSNPTDITTKEAEFKAGDIEISAGVGLMSTFVSKSAKARILPVSVMLNYRIKQFVSVGAYMGYSSTNGYNTETKNDLIPATEAVMRNDFYIAGARLEGHFNRERADFYGGAMLSYNISDVQKLDPDIDRIEGIIIDEGRQGGFKYSGYLGVKYMVTEHFGLFGEVGYGASLLSVGLTSKF
jgi:hypothetical protein